ncbi:MAG TPA: helix-turn-helix domain-containing protein [Thermodesulfobacteriota bacterium]|nr:helix-turn-helix domain-containing protein [Thermodesulfobacteriota bacterium]
MKDQSVKEKFIELRAKGLSYARISETLQVSKQTLVKWARGFECEISNLRQIEYEALQEQYYVAKAQRVALLAEQLKRIREEITGRSLKDVPTSQLLVLFLKILSTLKQEEKGIEFFEYEAINFDIGNTKKSWPG